MNEFIPMILLIAVAILIFIAIREFWAWYLKTNKLIENQDKIIRELKKQTRIFDDLSDKLTDLIPEKTVAKEEEVKIVETEITETLEKVQTEDKPTESNKVKCNDCNWEGKLKDLNIKEDRMGNYEVCPNCGSGKWDNI